MHHQLRTINYQPTGVRETGRPNCFCGRWAIFRGKEYDLCVGMCRNVSGNGGGLLLNLVFALCCDSYRGRAPYARYANMERGNQP
jgi:hypothetical protein